MKVLLIAILFSTIGFGQIKIDHVTIFDKKIAEEYFLYCYTHPDTTWFQQRTESDKEKQDVQKRIDEALRNAKDYLDSLVTEFNTGESYLRVISSYEYDLSKNNAGVVYRDDYKAGTTYSYVGYLTKHSPSDTDFIKWYVHNYDIYVYKFYHPRK